MSTFFLTLLIVAVSAFLGPLIVALYSAYGSDGLGVVFGIALLVALAHYWSTRTKPRG